MFKKMIATIVLVLGLAVGASASDVTFMWSPNQESNLAGYNIYCGTETGVYGPAEDASSPALVDGSVLYTMSGFVGGGTYYCVATAYDTDGFESAYSNEINFLAVDQIYPAPPALFQNVISRNNPDGSVDILDAGGNVLIHIP